MGLPSISQVFRDLLADSTDNFGRIVTGELTEIQDVAGEKDFTPERLRYYKDGTRRFLEYGTDANYSETPAGHLLEPDAGQTLRIETAARTPYPVGIDLWPSMAREINGPLSAGDVVGGGYGVIDLSNFDPVNVEYSGTTADGYFWYHTADTGLSEAILAGVRNGSVFDSQRVGLDTAASVLTIIEQRLNCYDVGPSLFRESYSDVADNRLIPQKNEPIGSVANDDGQGSAVFSHRSVMAIYRDTGNDAIGLEAGSIGVKASSDPKYKFKKKGHGMTLDVTNTAPGTYEVVGAIRGDNDRPEISLRIEDFEISTTPGQDVNNTEVLLIAVDPAETDADAAFPTDATPVEHNPANSVVEIVEDNTLTGPDAGDAGTDVFGPVTTNTMTNPGGYQLGRKEVSTEGTGSKTSSSVSGSVGVREIPDTDICLVLVDSDTSGTMDADFVTGQNS